MALQSSKDKGSKQVSTTYFCFQALGMAVPCNSREIKLRAFRMRCFFILSFQLCCLAVLCLPRSYSKCLKKQNEMLASLQYSHQLEILPKTPHLKSLKPYSVDAPKNENKTECLPFSTGKSHPTYLLVLCRQFSPKIC